MVHEEVRKKLKDYFQDSILYSESVEEIDGDESLIDKGYIDSTGIIGLVAFMEKAFGIKVYDDEIIPENFDCLNSIYTYVSGKVSRAEASVKGGINDADVRKVPAH